MTPPATRPRRRPFRRHAFWLPTPDDHVAAWMHVPARGGVHSTGVVICPPFGYEYTHSHRSLLYLADELAAAGFAATRFDYTGTGDSPGDESTAALVDRWVDGVRSAAQLTSEVLGGGPCTLFGLRLGASLAALAASRMEVQELVLWDPVANGRRFVREQEALHRITKVAESDDSEELDAGGFVLSRDTAGALRELRLDQLDLKVNGGSLLIDRTDLEPDGTVASRLADIGIEVERIGDPGYLDMMAEPQFTVVPSRTIHRVVRWLHARNGGPETHAPVLEDVPATRKRALPVSVEGQHRASEEIVRLEGAASLVGVLTLPDDPAALDRTVVVLPNSGAVHHVGPHRLYVELARRLAGAGFASLRLDLRNLGDSRMHPTPDENHPYPDTAVEDVSIGVDWLLGERGFGSYVVAGLCSGAHTAFHCGLELLQPGLRGVVPINPLTFFWGPHLSLETPADYQSAVDAHQYSRSVRSREKWAKLFRGEVDLRYVAGFLLRRTRDVARRTARTLLRTLGIRGAKRLEEALGVYETRGVPIHFVFSTTDPGHEILMDQAKVAVQRLKRSGLVSIAFIQDADHTFSKKPWRREALDRVIESVRTLDAPQPG